MKKNTQLIEIEHFLGIKLFGIVIFYLFFVRKKRD